ncbi:transglutaminase-like enzyme, predicted cysteine protease [Thioflavicoccus mobilis 8321]|uniref:Transglutaminase-like enzyme, predicted cysteine protease n=1 Tax=Thioflavicoccus mobilis 8321 TaxID=765912 RepID=L0H0C6_9GAMM|nr:transglutaminase family protein [Thioflavicoccus mobilis]AGA91080.1 transglutaminase-like enzyme, predicted cysteine protease [Thioflavicoccus mobilis 8321]
MRLHVSHVTRYQYAEPVSLCHSLARLKPRETASQRCLSTQIRVDPWPAVSRGYADFFGNRVNYFSIQQSHSSLEVTAQSEVEVTAPDLPDPTATSPWEEVASALRNVRRVDIIGARLFTLASGQVPPSPDATAFASPSFTPGRPILEAAVDLMGRIHREFDYDPNFTTIATPIDEVLAHRRGVCQDFAHLAIAGLRGHGLAARYVSGYLETLPPPGQPKLVGADASHAWFSVLVPGLGWIDLDPTNDQMPQEQYITTAVGRDYQDVAPLRGVFYGGGVHELTVAVDVDRVTA